MSEAWSKGVPDVDGVYWWRRSAHVVLGICQVVDGDVFIVAHAQPRYVAEGCEFLGPLHPADTERLVRLEKALNRIAGCDIPKPCPLCVSTAKATLEGKHE